MAARNRDGRSIEQLEERIRQLGGILGPRGRMPPADYERFLRGVLAFEEAPETTLVRELARVGVDLPDPATLDDAAVTAKLWEVIHALAAMRVFLSRTDHLNDPELYGALWREILPDEMHGLDDDPYTACHIDILGGWSNEDIQTHLKYYADEKERQRWVRDFPEQPLPPHEDLPYDRDRHLPQGDDLADGVM
jgi:hypothetical protein